VTFTWPLALLGLFAVPALAAAWVWWERRRRASQAAFGNPDLLPNVVDRDPGRLRALPLTLLLAALAAMIVGVARPHATVSVRREEATVVLAVDTSRSMSATDVKPTRLDAARAAARRFVAKVPDTFRVGVVAFATRAVVAVPPTQDRGLVSQALDSLHPGEGTAIGDAVALSLRVGSAGERRGGTPPPRAIVVLAAGARAGGRIAPAAAAAQAKRQHVPVYAVLVGTPEGTVEESLTGGFRRIIRVPPSPETLRQLANVTGGTLFTAPSARALGKVYEDLGSRLGRRRERREITDVFAGAAVALLLLAGSVSALLFRSVP
jgi:Ca-activated chloride channel family protein